MVDWQRLHGRHGMPWQKTRDPYRVWLSEIMLQQTQVTTVMGYYADFLSRFPTIHDLAMASQDSVMSAWSGLGYYSRARNLHRCAQLVMSEWGGKFPSTAAQLETLPGIGRSTAAAIASICFGERVTILDGNVKRVLTRVLNFDRDLATSAHEKQLWRLAQDMVPDNADDMPTYTQALMDLGATVCLSKRPHCMLCPVQTICLAHAQGHPERLPIKTKKIKRSQREHWWLWLTHSTTGKFWLERRPNRGVWSGLWTLPLFESESALQTFALQAQAVFQSSLPDVRHLLTHFDWTLHPSIYEMADAGTDDLPLSDSSHVEGRWVLRDEALALGIPTPLRRLLTQSD